MGLQAFIRNWGSSLCLIFFVAIITERALKRVHDEKISLSAHLSHLKKEKGFAMEKNEKLIKQINSQSDPAWIELVLKKELGLVPEGETKVLFTP